MTEKQFPTDIIEAAYKAFPKPIGYDPDIRFGDRISYMRGMLNERLSGQEKLAIAFGKYISNNTYTFNHALQLWSGPSSYHYTTTNLFALFLNHYYAKGKA